jgi:hypothetical protein
MSSFTCCRAHTTNKATAYWGRAVNGMNMVDTTWYDEASATWAEWSYVRSAGEKVHEQNFIGRFQRRQRTSLLMVDPWGNDPKAALARYEYGTYIWPYFMQQESNVGARALLARLTPGVTTTLCDQW